MPPPPPPPPFKRFPGPRDSAGPGTAPGLPRPPPALLRTDIKVDLLETLSQSLARATEGTARLSVGPMDRGAVPPGCANATQMRTATVAQLRTTAYGPGAAGQLQGSVAAALSVDVSLICVCRADEAAAPARRRRALLQGTPTPTATAAATPEPTAQATGPYDANPFSPTPTPALGTGEADVAVYVGNVDPSREAAVGQQLEALFAGSELPVLRGIVPPLRQVPYRPPPSPAPHRPSRPRCCTLVQPPHQAFAYGSKNTHPHRGGRGGGGGREGWELLHPHRSRGTPLAPPPPLQNRSDDRGTKRNVPSGKSGRAGFGAQLLGPSPPSSPCNTSRGGEGGGWWSSRLSNCACPMPHISRVPTVCVCVCVCVCLFVRVCLLCVCVCACVCSCVCAPHPPTQRCS